MSQANPPTKFSVKKKPKKLMKLSINKDKNSPFSSHVLSVLDKNNLSLYDSSEKKCLLEAVSEALFLNARHSDNLQKQCLNYLNKNFNKQNGKNKLNFLRTEKFFLRDYRSDPGASIFEAVFYFLFKLLSSTWR